MQQMIKKYLWVVLLAAGLQTGLGFALLGPEVPSNGADNWQTAVIGYQLAYLNELSPGGPNYLGDIGGPRDVGQEYRRNVPVIYYTYDPSFLTFFGSNGVAAVDSAVAIMNNLTNADEANLSQYPMDSQHINYEAQSLALTDLKSTTLHLLAEQMGLAQPTRYTWTLHDRVLPSGGTCPVNEEYLVTQRNYGETNSSLNEVLYSDYVNNTLYTYQIEEICSGPDPLAITIPFSTDPLSHQYTAVADSPYDTYGGLQVGSFYNGLTRDDVAGIDYMLSTNAMNIERVGTGLVGDPGSSYLVNISTNYAGTNGLTTQLFPVNTNSPTGFGTFNLGSLLSSATTNSPAVLAGLFPGLVVASSQNYFIVGTNATVTSYFTNPPYGSPVGTAPILKIVTNYTYVPVIKYASTFANVITQYYSTNTTEIIQTVTTGPLIGGVAGSVKTTTNNTTVVIKGQPSGSFYVLPKAGAFGTNLCPPGILFTLQTNVVYSTNLITAALTNLPTTTTNVVYNYSQSVITWYTNYTYETYFVNCSEDADATGKYEGIEKVQFVRKDDYDSELLEYINPATNNYNMVMVTPTYSAVTQQFVRVVTGPEILLTAFDDGQANTFNGTVTRSVPNWDESLLTAGGNAGPGVINPQSVLQYNNIGSAFYNGYDFYDFLTPGAVIGETTQVPSVAWASFDGSTNLPVLYPNGTSLLNLASQALIQISPTSLPDGTNGVPYSQQFSAVATRLTQPFTWSATGLPPGLTMSSTGLLSGTPIDQTGGSNSPLIYDITVILTDSLSNSVQWNYPITIQ